jgi:HAE1 family hydrophobic/amphiphilic exporter-1
VADFVSVVGFTGPNAGLVFLRLRPRDERPPVDAVIAALRAPLADIPGVRAFLQSPPAVNIGGQLMRALYQ